MIVGLTAIVRQKLNSTSHQPIHRIGAVFHERLGEVGIDIVLCYAPKIIQVILSCVLTEVGTSDVDLAEVRHQALDILCAMMNHPQPTTSELRVAPALLLRRAFKQSDFGAFVGSSQSRAQGGVPSTDNYDIATA